MRAQITLYGDDAERFKEYQRTIKEDRDGVEPGYAEMVRLMMDQFDPEAVVGMERQRRR